MMHHGFGYRYEQPEMVIVIGPVEIALTMIALLFAAPLGNWRAGFSPLRRSGLLWLAPLALMMAAAAAQFLAEAPGRFAALPAERKALIMMIAATTFLVGLSLAASAPTCFRRCISSIFWAARPLAR